MVSDQPRKTFALRLQDAGRHLDGDAFVRLRRALKYLLRVTAFRALDVRELPPAPADQPSARQADGESS